MDNEEKNQNPQRVIFSLDLTKETDDVHRYQMILNMSNLCQQDIQETTAPPTTMKQNLNHKPTNKTRNSFD